MLHINFKKLSPAATVPSRATDGSAGLDLYALEEKLIMPGERVLVPTGIALELPNGFEGQVRARSGNALKYGLGLVNGVGTIDSDYRGDVSVLLINHGVIPHRVHKGDRVAQLVIQKLPAIKLQQVEELDAGGVRGAGGFGSTGDGKQQLTEAEWQLCGAVEDVEYTELSEEDIDEHLLGMELIYEAMALGINRKKKWWQFRTSSAEVQNALMQDVKFNTINGEDIKKIARAVCKGAKVVCPLIGE